MQSLTLLANRSVADGLHELSFTKPTDWSFQAGQFARLGMAFSKEEPIFRAYSVASAPESDTLRFLVKNVTGGQLSPRLCALRPGDRISLDGPADGNLLASRVPGGHTLWLMATGSGLAPFLAMLESADTLREWPEIVTVIGCRTREEAEGLRRLTLDRSSRPVTLLTATTRETSALTGRLPDLLQSGELERAAGKTLNADTSRLLLCGNPGFTQSVRTLLKARGMVSPRFGKPGQILVEALW